MQTRQRCSRPSSCQHVSRDSTEDSGNGREDLRNVQEPVLVLVLLVDGAHQRSSWGKDLVDEDEDGLLRAELDALANHVDELAHGEICWNEILLLVDSSDVRLLDLLADDLYSGPSVLLLLLATPRGRLWVCVCVYGATYWNSVGVLLADALSFGLALLERVLVLKLGAHSGGWWSGVFCGGSCVSVAERGLILLAVLLAVLLVLLFGRLE